MLYGKYKDIRNAAWNCLLENNITALPVSPFRIARQNGIAVIKNSAVDQLQQSESGLTVCQTNGFFIVYDDGDSAGRCRFTVAHELGHIFLGHTMVKHINFRTFGENDGQESEADMFAARILMPACILKELNLHTPQEIMKACNVTFSAASIRSRRMAELYRRDCFYTNNLEREVKNNFMEYITNRRAEISSQ